MLPEGEISIRLSYRNCIKSFQRLLDVLKPSASVVSSTLNDQVGRLRAWAENAGAHRPPESRASLEHRLREAPKVRRVVVGLLVDLIDVLRIGNISNLSLIFRVRIGSNLAQPLL